MGGLLAAVVTSVPSQQRFAELAAAWLSQVREELLPEFDRGLKAGPSLQSGRRRDPWAPLGPPGGAHGALHVNPSPTLYPMTGSSRALYSGQSWQQMLDGLITARPFYVALYAEMLDDRGLRARPRQSMVIQVKRHHQQPGWVSLLVHAFIGAGPFDRGEAAAPYPSRRQRQWAEFVKAWAARSDASYAHVTDDALARGDTALEVALRVTAQENVPRCHEVLRGYSWVTVCAAELAARLGGTKALMSSGAFDEVTGLPAGQVFLRATPTVQDYEGEPVRRVFWTLAPVVLTGRPHPSAGVAQGRRLVLDADAADYE
jgi:hypothetical protein